MYSGSRSGAIHHHDVRQANHHVSTLRKHTQEVCGLKWSPDGKLLGSGGNDNILNIWDANMNASQVNETPLYSLSSHQAAVKVFSTNFTSLSMLFYWLIVTMKY